MKIRVLIAGIMLVVLASCGSTDREAPLSDAVISAVKSLGNRHDSTAKSAAQNQTIAQMSRAELAKTSTDPMILLFIELSGQYASLAQVSRNRQYATFFSSDQKSLSFSKGFLTGTRGLGADLLSLDVSQSRAGLQSGAQGPVSTLRIHRKLNAENEIETVKFSCTLERSAIETITSIHAKFRLVRFDETCVSRTDPAKRYTNNYWLDAKTRLMWKSRQWVNDVIGYLQFDVVVPERR